MMSVFFGAVSRQALTNAPARSTIFVDMPGASAPGRFIMSEPAQQTADNKYFVPGRYANSQTGIGESFTVNPKTDQIDDIVEIRHPH